MKTTHFGSAQWTLRLRSVSKALIFCIMLLTPLLFLGEGLGVRCFAQGAGNCLSYDGVNDYVQLPQSVTLSGLNAMTIESWIILDNVSGVKAISYAIGNCSCCPSCNRWYFQINNNTLGFGIKTGGNLSGVTTSGIFTANTWYHVTGVYDGNSIKIFVNGTEVVSSAKSGTIDTDTDGNKTIGVLKYADISFNTQYWLGQIDEVRIWNVARTETEIRDNMCKKLTGSESGLVGYWRFDEGSGSTVNDASGNGNDGTLY